MNDKEIVQLYWERNEQAISESSVKYGNYCSKIAKNILADSEAWRRSDRRSAGRTGRMCFWNGHS